MVHEAQLWKEPEKKNHPAIETKDEREKRYGELDRVIQRYAKEPGQLIRILQEAQNIFGHLPEEVQAYIAEKNGIPVSEVNGVVTFYSLFSTMPKGKYVLNLCMGTACYVKGARELMDSLTEQLEINEGETTLDRLFTVKSTRCIGACGMAPVLVVNDDVHGRISAKDLKDIINKYRKGENIENPKH